MQEQKCIRPVIHAQWLIQCAQWTHTSPAFTAIMLKYNLRITPFICQHQANLRDFLSSMNQVCVANMNEAPKHSQWKIHLISSMCWAHLNWLFCIWTFGLWQYKYDLFVVTWFHGDSYLLLLECMLCIILPRRGAQVFRSDIRNPSIQVYCQMPWFIWICADARLIWCYDSMRPILEDCLSYSICIIVIHRNEKSELH